MTKEKAFELACIQYAGYLSSYPEDAALPEPPFSEEGIHQLFQGIVLAAAKAGIPITEPNPS
jgi:hypothetical protein